jgi:type IV pilus assembly protein PilY1
MGTLLVSTNVLNASACTVGGDSWQYQFNFATGAYLDNAPGSAQGPIVATKVASALTVGVVVVRLPSGQLKAIVTDATGVKHTVAVTVMGGVAGGRRVSWRELGQ